ncbi:hypothetical protein ABL78_3439 [Leptomonas seymouri]|uniref:Uncharacterized protein n=1 Tax=Leptomonas seymouri TaxID=5684 RepID=A0A0N1HZJ4_LEPSE|nr:hypothetical protein ABL78_3439 [Leptomonas seymouri]|eukprot:KPI87490.1 hypothetical protein ABL78_3439 [Leptomonas seymouri]
MLSWLWDALFRAEVAVRDDTFSVSATDLGSVAEQLRTLQRTVESAKQALATTEESTRTFYQSIESLLMETHDATDKHAEVSPHSAELQGIRAVLEEQRSTVMKAMVKQKSTVEDRLFRAQVQLRALEKLEKSVEASARHLDDQSLHAGHVAFPSPVAPQFSSSAEEGK